MFIGDSYLRRLRGLVIGIYLHGLAISFILQSFKVLMTNCAMQLPKSRRIAGQSAELNHMNMAYRRLD